VLVPHTELARHEAAGSAPPPTQALLRVAAACQGLSGRALRKLPFIAHSFFVQAPSVSLDGFITALGRAAERESQSRAQMQA
jgi:hypothetical protein